MQSSKGNKELLRLGAKASVFEKKYANSALASAVIIATAVMTTVGLSVLPRDGFYLFFLFLIGSIVIGYLILIVFLWNEFWEDVEKAQAEVMKKAG